MSVLLLDAMAQVIYVVEGSHPWERAYRNNNPGNLRLHASSGYKLDENGFTVFPSFIDGYQALIRDIWAKISGNNTHGLSMSSSLYEFFEVYAPSSGGNNPKAYAQYVASWLGSTYGQKFDAGMSFAFILHVIGQELGDYGKSIVRDSGGTDVTG